MKVLIECCNTVVLMWTLKSVLVSQCCCNRLLHFNGYKNFLSFNSGNQKFEMESFSDKLNILERLFLKDVLVENWFIGHF